MILSSQRHLFDIPRDVCYVNTAYMSPLLKSQREVGEQALETASRPWQISQEDFFTDTLAVCRLGAELMNASADDVVIVPSASYGISTAAKNLPLGKGGAVLVMAEEFPSNYYAWRAKAEAEGGIILSVPVPEDEDWTSAMLDVMHAEADRIEIVSLANIHWSSGAAIDLKVVSEACKKIDAALVLDLSQSLGAMPFDVAEIDPDFMVSAGYKWLLAPYGISLMYVAPRWHGGTPLEEGWITRKNAENFAGLVNYQDHFQPGARRYEMGERANFILSPIFKAGLAQLVEWGVTNISETVAQTNAGLAEIVRECGYRTVPVQHRCGHILGVHVGAEGPALQAALGAAGVSVSLRGELMRIAPHLWVDDEDCIRFEMALKKYVSK